MNVLVLPQTIKYLQTFDEQTILNFEKYLEDIEPENIYSIYEVDENVTSMHIDVERKHKHQLSNLMCLMSGIVIK